MYRTLLYLLIVALFAASSCSSSEKKADDGDDIIGSTGLSQVAGSEPLIKPEGSTLQERFSPPNGFKRINAPKGSMGEYLRELPLKPHGSEVLYYNGKPKTNYNVYLAVVEMEIGHKDLHQCADACMRLRAEYLWENEQYDKIHFNFTNGFRVDYSRWMNGDRVAIDGNKTWWKSGGRIGNEYSDFWKYMELIWSYAGTASLDKELPSVPLASMQIGDLFIQGGHPGHAVLVVDMIENESGDKMFMLAQSYMPAQEMQILSNPSADEDGPWYALGSFDELRTPEWTFSSTDLHRWVD